MRASRIVLAVVSLALLGALGWYLLSSSPATTSTTSSAPTTTTLPANFTAVWPTTTGTKRFASPTAVVRAFATRYLGMNNPIVHAFQAGDTRSGEVPVQTSTKGVVTTVLVRQLLSDNSWWVLGAVTPDIQITAPHALALVTSPLNLTGRGTAYEGVINVSLRRDRGAPVANATVMGAMGFMAPFHTSLAFTTPSSQFGALVLCAKSAKDGSTVYATVIRVRFH